MEEQPGGVEGGLGDGRELTAFTDDVVVGGAHGLKLLQ